MPSANPRRERAAGEQRYVHLYNGEGITHPLGQLAHSNAMGSGPFGNDESFRPPRFVHHHHHHHPRFFGGPSPDVHDHFQPPAMGPGFGAQPMVPRQPSSGFAPYDYPGMDMPSDPNRSWGDFERENRNDGGPMVEPGPSDFPLMNNHHDDPMFEAHSGPGHWHSHRDMHDGMEIDFPRNQMRRPREEPRDWRYDDCNFREQHHARGFVGDRAGPMDVQWGGNGGLPGSKPWCENHPDQHMGLNRQRSVEMRSNIVNPERSRKFSLHENTIQGEGNFIRRDMQQEDIWHQEADRWRRGAAVTPLPATEPPSHTQKPNAVADPKLAPAVSSRSENQSKSPMKAASSAVTGSKPTREGPAERHDSMEHFRAAPLASSARKVPAPGITASGSETSPNSASTLAPSSPLAPANARVVPTAGNKSGKQRLVTQQADPVARELAKATTSAASAPTSSSSVASKPSSQTATATCKKSPAGFTVARSEGEHRERSKQLNSRTKTGSATSVLGLDVQPTRNRGDTLKSVISCSASKRNSGVGEKGGESGSGDGNSSLVVPSVASEDGNDVRKKRASLREERSAAHCYALLLLGAPTAILPRGALDSAQNIPGAQWVSRYDLEDQRSLPLEVKPALAKALSDRLPTCVSADDNEAGLEFVLLMTFVSAEAKIAAVARLAELQVDTSDFDNSPRVQVEQVRAAPTPPPPLPNPVQPAARVVTTSKPLSNAVPNETIDEGVRAEGPSKHVAIDRLEAEEELRRRVQQKLAPKSHLGAGTRGAVATRPLDGRGNGRNGEKVGDTMEEAKVSQRSETALSATQEQVSKVSSKPIEGVSLTKSLRNDDELERISRGSNDQRMNKQKSRRQQSSLDAKAAASSAVQAGPIVVSTSTSTVTMSFTSEPAPKGAVHREEPVKKASSPSVASSATSKSQAGDGAPNRTATVKTASTPAISCSLSKPVVGEAATTKTADKTSRLGSEVTRKSSSESASVSAAQAKMTTRTVRAPVTAARSSKPPDGKAVGGRTTTAVTIPVTTVAARSSPALATESAKSSPMDGRTVQSSVGSASSSRSSSPVPPVAQAPSSMPSRTRPSPSVPINTRVPARSAPVMKSLRHSPPRLHTGAVGIRGISLSARAVNFGQLSSTSSVPPPIKARDKRVVVTVPSGPDPTRRKWSYGFDSPYFNLIRQDPQKGQQLVCDTSKNANYMGVIPPSEVVVAGLRELQRQKLSQATPTQTSAESNASRTAKLAANASSTVSGASASSQSTASSSHRVGDDGRRDSGHDGSAEVARESPPPMSSTASKQPAANPEKTSMTGGVVPGAIGTGGVKSPRSSTQTEAPVKLAVIGRNSGSEGSLEARISRTEEELATLRETKIPRVMESLADVSQKRRKLEALVTAITARKADAVARLAQDSYDAVQALKVELQARRESDLAGGTLGQLCEAVRNGDHDTCGSQAPNRGSSPLQLTPADPEVPSAGASVTKAAVGYWDQRMPGDHLGQCWEAREHETRVVALV